MKMNGGMNSFNFSCYVYHFIGFIISTLNNKAVNFKLQREKIFKQTHVLFKDGGAKYPFPVGFGSTKL